MKIFKKSKKFKKVKALKKAVNELTKENERIRGQLTVKEQEIDRAANILYKANE